MGHENDKEIVLTKENFRDLTGTFGGAFGMNPATGKWDNPDVPAWPGAKTEEGKPVYYLDTATGTKREIQGWYFKRRAGLKTKYIYDVYFNFLHPIENHEKGNATLCIPKND